MNTINSQYSINKMDDGEPSKLYQMLLRISVENKEYFGNYKDEKSRKLSSAFVTLEEQIENILPLLEEFRKAAPSYDFRNVPANGYRSFIVTVDKLTRLCLKISQNVTANRNSLFFHKSHYVKQIEECGRIYTSFNHGFQLLKLIRASSDPGQLFVNKPEKVNHIEKISRKVNIRDFFGRFLAFQSPGETKLNFKYGESTQPIIKTISIMMTAFAEYYYNRKNVIQWAALCSQFFANSDLRAARMAQVICYESITAEFCQTFLNMSEHDIIKKMNVLFFPASVVNEVIELPPEPIQYQRDGDVINIPIPSAHIGPKSLKVRLISAVKREGMNHFKKISEKNSSVLPASDWFIFHVHGGGFISHTSESHHVYLKEWTTWTDAPILSVDYSLAPEAPYPRAFQEILYAYVWALNNIHHLGTTAKRIVFAGDSAGGNLCISLTLKCIDMKIRKPDGLFLAYTPTVLQFYPCPSRFLGLMDPLLSFGFMMVCIKAYVHVKNDLPSSSSDETTSKQSESPISYDDKSFEDFLEKNSADNERRDSARTLSLSSFGEDPSDFEENSAATDPLSELSLPEKYKNIVKGFVSSLKEKLNHNLSKSRKSQRGRNTFYSDIASIEQLIGEVQDNQFLSPSFADDKYFKDFPPTSIMTVEMDPCIDDCVTFARKLDRLDAHVHMDILKNLCHGFLNFSLANKEAFEGSVLAAQRVKELLSGTLPK